MSYLSSGVNRQLADRFVEQIQGLSKKTLNRRVKAAVGGYASLYALDRNRWIAASTDGVGTKLKLAFQLHDHSTVGIDLVAMSVNDLLCVGAEPLFFLDYFATGKLDPTIGGEVLKGIVEGCRQAQCALVGGETAEMPDFYHEGEYDLAGFAVGMLKPAQVLPRKDVRPGDVILGIASSGLHSNGFSLIRKILPQDELLRTLLTPTRIYTRALLPVIQNQSLNRGLKGLAHITGSGFLNVPRISEKVSYDIHLPPSSERPPVFQWVEQRLGKELGYSFEELAQTFNLGIGMVVITSTSKSAEILRKIKRSGETAWVLGEVVKKRRGRSCEVFLKDGDRAAVLEY